MQGKPGRRGYDRRMALDVDIGWHSVRGPRDDNEDFAAAQEAAPHEAHRGLVAAIADGVSTGGRGREAAQTTVMCLVQDYFGTPPTWDTSVALDRLIGAQNAWLAAGNRRQSRGAMTTLTALVLRGHSYTLAHVGDTRAWLLRGGEWSQLTNDHVFDHPDMKSRLTRAVGLDDHVRVDYLTGDLQAGDVFVLTTDGVHGALAAKALGVMAAEARGNAQAACQAMVDAALRAGSWDNASALVIHVRGLAAVRLEDVLLGARQLPVPGRLKVGESLDRYTVTALVADTGVHRLYQARDNATGELVALKTLHESRAGDAQERAMLAHEAWLGLRLGEQGAAGADSGFIGVREPRAPSAFYAVFDWQAGSTLEQLLAQRQAFSVPQVVEGAIAVGKALGRLHRQGVIHRDIKPGNLHLGEDGRWRILDLGVAVSGQESALDRTLHAGTPSYMNPEQWEVPEGQAVADARSDLYALGATLYQWLTGHLPYGEVEPYQLARFRRDPRPPSRLRPDVPMWLDHVVMRAVARDARQRFETAEEFVLALERGAARPLERPAATPYFSRDPAGIWKAALAASAALNLLLLFWLLFLPR